MKGRSPGGRLAGSSTAAHNAGLNNADKAKQNWAQGPEGMAGGRAGGGKFMWAPRPLGNPENTTRRPPAPSPRPARAPPGDPAAPPRRWGTPPRPGKELAGART